MKRFFNKLKEKFEFKNIFNICLFTLSILIILFSCIYDNNLAKLICALPTLNPFWLSLAIIAMFSNWIIDANIIKIITKSVYYNEYNFIKSIKITMVGQFFSAITPFGIAGQPMQIIASTRQGVSSGIAISVLVRKFLIYQTTITFYSLIVITFKYNFFSQAISGFMTLALIGFISQASVVLLLVLFSINKKFTTKLITLFFKLLSKTHIIKNPEQIGKKVEEQLNFYLENNKNMNHDSRLNVKLYIMTFIQLTVLFSVPFLIYKAYHYPGFPFIDMVSSQALLTMIASYTPLPGGSGTNEGGFIMIFNMFFSDADISQAMLLWRFITYYFCIIAGLFFAKLGKKQSKLSLALPPTTPNN